MDDCFLGIDIGGTSIKFGLVDSDGSIHKTWRIETNISNNGQNIVPEMFSSIRDNLTNQELNDLMGIGVGSPGSVNFSKGTVRNAFNLNWQETQNLKEVFESEFKIPFAIDNDANVAALGERWMGAGDNQDDVVFVTLGTGVGGGVIADGNLLHGIAGSAGEIGHLIVDPDGYLCTCGNRGCLETIASATGIARIAKETAPRFPGSKLFKESLKKELTAKDVFELAKNNDETTVLMLDRIGYYLALGLGQIANILNPQYLIIGGGVSASGQFLIDLIMKFFPELAFPNVVKTTSIKLAQLGNDAGVLGATYLIKEQISKGS